MDCEKFRVVVQLFTPSLLTTLSLMCGSRVRLRLPGDCLLHSSWNEGQQQREQEQELRQEQTAGLGNRAMAKCCK